MKISDYQILLISALTRYPKLREVHVSQLREDMFDDVKHRFMVEPLQTSDNTTKLVEKCESIGGIAFIRNISRVVDRLGSVAPSDISDWIDRLENYAKRRQVEMAIDVAKEELNVLSDLAQIDKTISHLVDGLVGIFNTRGSQGPRTLDSVADDFIESIVSGVVGSDKISTGFPSLDDFLLGGLPRGLVLLGGPPGAGKTQLSIQMALNEAKQAELEVGKSGGRIIPGVVSVNSAEMVMSSLLERIVQCETGIQIQPNLSKSDKKKMIKSMQALRSLPLVIDDSDMLTSKLIYARTESLFLKYGQIRLIVTDFVELIADEGGESRERQIAQVAIRSKVLSRRYGCPHILVSQLSRDAAKGGTKVPSMDHLRYSGMLEQLGDVVMLIYNPYHYIQTGKRIDTPVGMPATPGTSYIIIDKNKFGPTGPVVMGWDGPTTTWSDKPKEGMYHNQSDNEIPF